MRTPNPILTLAVFCFIQPAVSVAGQEPDECEDFQAFWSARRSAGIGGPSTTFAGYHGLQHRFAVERDARTGSITIRGPVVVARVFCGSPAWEAGLRAGDEILEVNGRKPTESGILAPREVGMTFELLLQRGGGTLRVTLITVPRPTPG